MTDMNIDKQAISKPNGWALAPLFVFFALYIITFIIKGDLSQMPISVAFLAASITAILATKGHKMAQRVNLFCRGAANDTIMLMVVIFILAGAFAGTAKAMGAVDATVNMILHLLPEKALMASIFVAGCFVSMAMGTSCGTIAALAPIAVGISGQTDISLPAMLGIVIGGAMFGDNLSFISDTTIVATRTQGCQMMDKFKANILIVLPVVVIILLLYIYQGLELSGSKPIVTEEIEWVRVIPYLAVLIAALASVNVITVLVIGIVLSGVVGLITNGFGIWDWTSAISNGIVNDMGELIIVSLMAGGMFELIRVNGGVDWIIQKMTKRIKSKRSAELAIGGLVSFTNLCTANNTIALIITGPIAKTIGDKFELDKRKIASLLDTFSCFVQGLIPYGAQLLIAAGLAGVNPMEIVPYLYYPMLLGIAALIAILFRFPRRYS